jgi:hypothetical protein
MRGLAFGVNVTSFFIWSLQVRLADSFLAEGPKRHHRANLVKRSNFFKNVFEKAFDNDSSLSQNDKLKGMLEGPGDDDVMPASSQGPKLTATQEKWRRAQEQPVSTTSLQGKVATMDFYLTGVPDKDPSNDLFAEKENISSRDRQVGLTVPKEPTVTAVCVEFLSDNKCRCCTSSIYTKADSKGDWRVSEDGSEIRFRIPVMGFTRTVQTKGSIQKIYWSNEEEKSTQTSTTYSIEAGWMYGEAILTASARGELQWNDGILKVEQSMGLLKAASRMIPCGKFSAKTSSDISS